MTTEQLNKAKNLAETYLIRQHLAEKVSPGNGIWLDNTNYEEKTIAAFVMGYAAATKKEGE